MSDSDALMFIFADNGEVEKMNIVPNRWVEFLRAWDWHCPAYKPLGRVTVSFAAGTRVRLTRAQLQSAMAAGVVVSIPSPRGAGAEVPHG